jgi:quinol monooxygenase YgiN
MIIFTGQMRVPEEKAAAFEAAIDAFSETVREKEPGVIFYGGGWSAEEPGTYLMVEIYRDEAAIAAHAAAEHFQVAMREIPAFCEGEPVVRRFDSRG